jgi:hypothetical protein
MNSTNYQTTKAEPDASSMIETFRAIGYSMETAIADIMDNSISAGAKNIWLNYDWKGENTIIRIKDDGYGMNGEELIQAMRPGSRHPLEERSSKDLGRFGLGLKTASFSQTRKFSVLSKKEGYNPVYWAWDLDHVNKVSSWELIQYIPSSDLFPEIESMNSGTSVIWYCLDRTLKGTVSDDKEAMGKFMEIMEKVKFHLEMVFHRFIEQGKIIIWVQDRKVEAWDPFLKGKKGLQISSEEFFGDNMVNVKGYVLPHKSKLTEQEFKRAAGPKGWNEQQGFYIYRNQRLLVAGDWLGMFQKEEHNKLCRILIDLPNTIDDKWQIDIKKSVARPPIKVRSQLKAYAKSTRSNAVEVYRYKGKVLKRKYKSTFIPVWQDEKRRGKLCYKINREHPVISSLTDNPTKVELNRLLHLLEETVPISSITIKEALDKENYITPFENIGHNQLKEMISEMVTQLTLQGKSLEDATSIILTIEPFDQYPEYVCKLIDHI